MTVSVTTLNVGIVAHVDAGKTTLTEQLLFHGGALERAGSVDAGDTVTDRGAIERRRGITIRSAVAALRPRPGLRVNLIDTPGHADFASEVDRALGVLDGVVLVVSALDPVQAQTRLLMRAVTARRLPCLLFLNKLDQPGTDPAVALRTIRTRLTARAVLASEAEGPEVLEMLADHSDELLTDVVSGRVSDPETVRAQLRRQTAQGRCHPVFAGSALHGRGVPELLTGITELVAPRSGAVEGQLTASVFALADESGGGRGVDGPRGGGVAAYVRVFSGQLRHRDRTVVQRRAPDGQVVGDVERLTSVVVVDPPDHASASGVARAGEVALIRGPKDLRVGDELRAAGAGAGATGAGGVGGGGLGGDRVAGFDGGHPLAVVRPGLRTVVRARRVEQAGALHAALRHEQARDPLLSLRVVSDGAVELALVGEVQAQVLREVLATRHGLAVEFEPATVRYLEQPLGCGHAVEELDLANPTDFCATVGLRVEPGPEGRVFRREVELGALPLAFHRAIEEAALATLDQGVHGWPVSGCAITLTKVGFFSPVSTSADFRLLTPLVLMAALLRAGVRVLEPCERIVVDVPSDTVGAVLTRLASAEARVTDTEPVGSDGAELRLIGTVPTRAVAGLRHDLPGLTRGEALVTTGSGPPRPVRGVPPERTRTDGDPRNRRAYLTHLANQR
jgi:ribosomal protection tetracycline resistance protein